MTIGGIPVSVAGGEATLRGQEELHMRHFKEAVTAFEQACELEPGNPVAWNNLGSAHLTMGELGNAESNFKKALKIDPNYALAHYNYGVTRDLLKDYEGAIAAYTRALELDPELQDPGVNPAIVNNEHLVAVHLLLYRRQAGSLGAGVTPVVREEPE